MTDLIYRVLRTTYRWAATAVIAVAVSWIITSTASAFEIQKVKSPGGLEAWLVEEHSIPLIAARFAFDGGTALDPQDRLGLANVLSGMLDEGAGDIESQAFQKRLQQLAVKLSFEAGRDNFFGRLQTLTRNKDEAFDLLRMALTEPRFDDGPLQRIKQQILISLRRAKQDPNEVAVRSWMKIAFGTHPYAENPDGTMKGVEAVTSEDLRKLRAKLFALSGLKIAVVGDIDAATLGQLLDKTFGTLPKESRVETTADPNVARGPVRKIITMDIPQSVIQFGNVGILRKDPDFIPAYILNHILGGGGFSSRLTEEVREKRGLSYSVYSYLAAFDHAGLFMGGAATQNERAGEALKVIASELERMAKSGPTEEELEAAKTYLTGSYALRFDTSTKIAGQLLGIQLQDLGIDYVVKRNDLINAVTLEDVKRVARRLLHPNHLIVTVVGRPQGVAESTSQ